MGATLRPERTQRSTSRSGSGEVRELQGAAVAGALLAVGFVANLADASGAELASNAAALVVGASTFVPSTLRRLRRGKIGVGTLMTIAAVGAVILGQVGEAAMLAFLYSAGPRLGGRPTWPHTDGGLGQPGDGPPDETVGSTPVPRQRMPR